jgi:hypothetical protein
MHDILDLNLGKLKGQTVTVKDIKTDTVPSPRDGSTLTKVILVCETKQGQTRNIDEGWVKDHKGSLNCQGLWVTLDDDGEISAACTLGKLLKYWNMTSVKGLIGAELRVLPKSNGFLGVATTNISDSEL